MTIWLFDSNVLIALSTGDHVHHRRAVTWFDHSVKRFATCPMTQSALLRFHMQFGRASTPASAWGQLAAINEMPRHEFWPDDIGFTAVAPDRLTGHRQVNDAYLAALARHRKGRLATLDAGLARLHSDVATLIPE